MPRTLPGKPMRWTPRGASDSQDGSNTFPGAMTSLSNLIPSPTTAGCWVPRAASIQLTAFAGFTSPAQVNALLQVGNIVYGVIAETSGAFNGKDVPFAYNRKTNVFETITITGGAASLPATPASVGDWTPPEMVVVGSRVLLTHPGFAGGASPFFGWLDISGFSSTTITGNTHTNTTIDNLSTNVLLAGWKPGMLISDLVADLPANTTIVSIAVGGLSIVISNAATGTNATTFTVTGGTKTAPLYGSGNTNGVKLSAVPVAVINFNGRAYYAVPGAGTQFSDALDPTQITNATQALNPANGLDITAFGALGLQQTQGGILEAVIAFQGDAQMQQITGDPATNNLALNAMSEGVGTLAPNTVTPTLQGLAFIAPDGMRIIDINGRVSEPIGANGDGICFPFLSAVSPSRMTAAFNQNVIRISVQNGAAFGTPVQEWWFDFRLKVWSGPHNFPAAQIVADQTSAQGFIMAPSGVNGKLFSSSVTPTLNDTFVENGVQMVFDYQTALWPDHDQMCESKIVQMTLAAAISPNENWQVIALDEGGAVIDQVSLQGSSLAPALWGTAKWGGFVWGGPTSFLYRHPIAWHEALIFKQMALQVSGNCALGTIVGAIDTQIEELGFLTQASG